MSYRNEVIAFEEAVKGGSYYVFDTETTGLNPVSCDIIEFSAIRINVDASGSASIGDKLDVYINPGYPIPTEITEITGITQEKINSVGIGPKTAFDKIRAFLGDSPYLMGYNSVSFDTKFMNALYAKCGYEFTPALHLDVLKMAKEKVEKPHKLINMADKFGVSAGLSFHTSIDDAMATYLVYTNILPMYAAAPAPEEAKIEITRIQRWQKGSFDRIYVNTRSNQTIYYDVVNDELVNFTECPDEEVISLIFTFAGVSSIEELKIKYK